MSPRRHAPSAERNRDPILDVLTRALPARASVLELASGSGQHAAYFASKRPGWTWQPTDADAGALAGIDEWASELDADAGRVLPALRLDVLAPWPPLPHGARLDAVVCINLLHISAPSAVSAVMGGAAAALPPGGLLYLYGPYKRGGAHTAPSNEAFEGWLKGLDPSYGVRDLESVMAEGERRGLRLTEVVTMPAHNWSVLFRRA